MMELTVEILLMIAGAALVVVGGKSQISYSRRMKANEFKSARELVKPLLTGISFYFVGVFMIVQLGPLYRWLP